MDKKKYQQPTTWVVELQHQSQLLAGSPDLYGGQFGSRGLDMDDIDNTDDINSLLLQ